MEILGDPPVPATETAGHDADMLRRRGLATLVDVAVCYFVVEGGPLALAIEYYPTLTEQYANILLAASLVFFLPVYLTYCFYFEWHNGRTLGKAFFSLCVASADGDPLTARASAVRNLLRYVDVLPVAVPYLVGLVAALDSDAGQRLGDRLAGTVVARPRRAVDPAFAQKRE